MLDNAGFLFDIPPQYTPDSRIVPTPQEVAPWIDTIIRLWDDSVFYEQERERCEIASAPLRSEALAPLFERFFWRIHPRQ